MHARAHATAGPIIVAAAVKVAPADAAAGVGVAVPGCCRRGRRGRQQARGRPRLAAGRKAHMLLEVRVWQQGNG